MSFLKYQKENPEFLNNYLKYKRYIEGCAESTVNESYFDLRTLFRYIKLYLYDNDKLNKIVKDDFKKIEIKEITIIDLSKMTEFKLEEYIVFLANVLENDVASRNKKLASRVEEVQTSSEATENDITKKLENILSKIKGVGKVGAIVVRTVNHIHTLRDLSYRDARSVLDGLTV